MFEENDNQVVENDTDFLEGLGLTESEDSEVEVEAEETTEVEEETEESKETTETEVADEVEEEVSEKLEDLEVKFLHETKKLSEFTKDELKSYVQKGMNADRVNEKLNQVNEKYNKVEELAKLYGMSDTEIIDTLFTNYFESTDNPAEAKSKYEAGKKEATTKMYAKFVENYPKVTNEDIPQTIWDRVNQGEDLNEVYKEHMYGKEKETYSSEVVQLKKQLEEANNKLKVKEQNDTVKKKAVVKKSADSGNTESDDDFLAGLLGS